MKKRRKPHNRFAVCIKNKGYEASLEIGKLYRVVPDQVTEGHETAGEGSGQGSIVMAPLAVVHRAKTEETYGLRHNEGG